MTFHDRLEARIQVYVSEIAGDDEGLYLEYMEDKEILFDAISRMANPKGDMDMDDLIEMAQDPWSNLGVAAQTYLDNLKPGDTI